MIRLTAHKRFELLKAEPECGKKEKMLFKFNQTWTKINQIRAKIANNPRMDPTDYNLPSDYIYSHQPFGSFFYKLYDKMDYTAAKNTCEQLGAVLPVPRSTEENEYFGTIGRNHDKHIWLGINDIVNEGEFVDNDGLPISFQNWNTGQPDNVGNEDAVELQSSEDHSIGFKWNDIRESSGNAAPLCVFYL